MVYQSKVVIENEYGDRIKPEDAILIIKDYVWKQFKSQAKDITAMYNDDFVLDYDVDVDVKDLEGITLAELINLAGLNKPE